MVLSFGGYGDSIEDELAGADGSMVISSGAGGAPIVINTPSTSSSPSGDWSSFLGVLGKSLLGTGIATTGSVLANQIGAKTPEQQKALLLQQQAAAAASRNQMLMIGGILVAAIVGGALLLRRRSAAA